MLSIKKGVGSFTADHIVAVLRALPDTDGTYAQVIARATEHGAQLFATTLGKWLTTGRADIEAGNVHTPYGRFSLRYDSIMTEHCSPDANRNRQLDRAFELLERTCECGNDKVIAPDGSLADRCRECQERDRRGLQYRTARPISDPSPPQDHAA